MTDSYYHVGLSASTGGLTLAPTTWTPKGTGTFTTLPCFDRNGFVSVGIDGSRLGTMGPAGAGGNRGEGGGI